MLDYWNPSLGLGQARFAPNAKVYSNAEGQEFILRYVVVYRWNEADGTWLLHQRSYPNWEVGFGLPCPFPSTAAGESRPPPYLYGIILVEQKDGSWETCSEEQNW